MKNFIQSSTFTKLITALGVLVAALLVFWLGTVVGYRQAEFSSRWAGHYADVFGTMHGPFAFPGFGRDADDINTTNGAIGTVMSVNLPTVAVKNPNEAEKVVLISPKTVIRKFRAAGTTTDIRTGDFLVTVGTPDDDGRIVATFVRIMPPMPTTTPVR